MAPFALLLSLALSAPILSTLGQGCDVNIPITPLPSPLTQSTLKPVFVAFGVGTQNYTCASGTYTNVGALAEMFDISCFGNNTVIFNSIPDMAIAAWQAAPPALSAAVVISTLHKFTSPGVLGQHYFVPNANGQGLAAKWDFTSQGALAGNSNAFVVAAKVNQSNAPTGNQDIAWVSLKGVTGQLAQQIYRTDTRLGQPPANCTPGSPDIAVKYVAKYWFYNETVSIPPTTTSSSSTSGASVSQSSYIYPLCLFNIACIILGMI